MQKKNAIFIKKSQWKIKNDKNGFEAARLETSNNIMALGFGIKKCFFKDHIYNLNSMQ